MRKNNFEILYVAPDKLHVNPNNAKRHTEEQVEQIKASIDEFGFLDPIAVDEDFNIIEGHGRLMSAVENGIEQVPVFIIPGLSEEQKTAYSLVHNQLTNNTGFDSDLLQEELNNIQTDMKKYSFDLKFEEYFGEEQEPEKQTVIQVAVSNARAQELRDFLDSNKVKYTEKQC